MDSSDQKDMEAIEKIHKKDIAAMKTGDYETLKSLMDAQCKVFPPDSEPEMGHAYLDRYSKAMDPNESQPEIKELTQDWEEILLLGDYAYEQGVVRYSIQDSSGKVLRETQRLMRVLRRQMDGEWRVYRAMWQNPRSESDS